MGWQYSPYALLFVAASIISIHISGMAWRRRNNTGVISFFILMCAVSIWSLGSALEWMRADLEGKLLFVSIQYIGIVLVPVACLILAIEYTGHQEWVNRKLILLLLIEPVVFLTLIWTNRHHGLVWSEIDATRGGSFFDMVDYGIAFWIHVAYSYVLLLKSFGIILVKLFKSLRLYRKQNIALLVGMSIPWLVNVLYVFRLGPWSAMNMTPLAFIIMGIIFGWALSKLKLLDLVPIARHALIENMPDAILVLDSQDRIVDLNKQAKEFLRIDDDAIGEPVPAILLEYMPPPADSPCQRQYKDVIEIEADGSRRYYDFRITSLCNRGGGFIGRLLMMRDVTEEKKAKQALLELNEKLEQMVQDRTAKLEAAQKKVIQQEKLSALGSLASGIAHDFNNSLSPILGYSDLLIRMIDHLDNEKIKEYLQMIHTSAQDAANIVSRLREFYRGKTSREQLAPVDLNQIVKQAIDLTRPKWRNQAQMRDTSIQIRTHLGELPPIACNETEIREALINLIINAADSISDEGTITISTESLGSYVRIRVSDDGRGMDEETKRRCFEPFFSTKGHQGTGLGLAMAYGTVQRHDGEIEIESEPGKGSTFIITLPVRNTDEIIGKSPVVSVNARRLHVLVVDDEESVRDVIARFLEADGHTAETAINGQEALAMVRSKHFDLVVTDLAMPEMNGMQLISEMRRNGSTIPVIIITGFDNTMFSDVTGHDVVLTKPIILSDFRNAVLKAMARERNEQRLATA